MTGVLHARPPELLKAPLGTSGTSWSIRAALVIIAAAFLNLAYIADCPLDLAPDEAHYWDWSRHLDWSYYSKGPLVAWLIRGSCELLGTTVFAVRLPAVICQALALIAVYVLASRCLRSPKLGLITVLITLTLPPVAAAGVVMTIDPPFLACWAWACVCVHLAILRNSGTSMWAAAGVIVAVGILAKYTMLLWPLCLAGYVMTDRRRRLELQRTGFWLVLGLSVVGWLPILYWNVLHDWISVRHVMALAHGPADNSHVLDALLRVVSFLCGQAALLLGFWFGIYVMAAWNYAPYRSKDPHRDFLWWFSVPVWLFFAAESARTNVQPNWPAPAYITGIMLAIHWIAEQWRHRPLRKWLLRAGTLASVSGFFVIFCAHYPGLVRPLLAKLVSPPSPDRPAPVRQLDPTCRLAGWRTLAAAVDNLRDRVSRQEGQDPVLAGMVWTLPGELGFYCRGNPQAYSIGARVADRHSQYDIWRPNPIADAQVFRGRTFLYVGEQWPEMTRVFGRVELPVEVIASDGEIPIASWKVWVCHDFQGFPAGDGRQTDHGY